MTAAAAECIRKEPRFRGISRFDKRVPLISSVMYGDEKNYVEEALSSGFSGENIRELERETAEYIGVPYAVATNSGTAAVHMALRLAAEKAYGSVRSVRALIGAGKGGALRGQRVFCSDLTTSAMVNPVIYEGGEPVFIDASPEDWGMDPEVLEMAFEQYPDVKIVIMAHLYGYPGQVERIQEICKEHNALLIEDASESLGAKFWIGEGETDSEDGEWRQAGSFGDYGILSFGKDKIITGGSGGVLLIKDYYSYRKAKNWASQAKAAAPWNQYEELGRHYEMSDLTAGIIRAQFQHLEEHIARKKAIYRRYQERFDEGLMLMNPIGIKTSPNYWISCMTVESSIVFKETRSEREYTYISQHGTAAPMEILDVLAAFGAESKPIWKPMHLQPVFWNYDQITLDGSKWTYENFYDDVFWIRCDEGVRAFNSGVCLPSDIRMTEEEQERVIEIVLACFDKPELERRI